MANNKPAKSTVLKDTTSLAEYFYNKVLVQFDEDEKWNSERKIRNCVNDAMFYVAQGAGSANDDSTEWDWNYARKNLYALKTMYTFSAKQGLVELEPAIVVKIDKLIKEIDSYIKISRQAIDDKYKKDLEPWLEKYRIWKELSKGKLDLDS